MSKKQVISIASKDALNRLVEDVNTCPLALFVGAGVNLPSVSDGTNEDSNLALVPSWNDLLLTLFKKAIQTEAIRNSIEVLAVARDHEQLKQLLSSFDIYAQASIVKSLLGRSYISIVQREIYKRYRHFQDWNDQRHTRAGADGTPYQVLHELSKLCCCTRLGGVITYNYDCYLSQAAENVLKKPARKLDDIYRSQLHSENRTIAGTLPIYHVHGYLPHPMQILREDDPNIVLSLDEYFANMIEPYSWQTTTQLYFLSNLTCLFVGTSLEDVNMRRLIAYARTSTKKMRCYIIMLQNKSDTTIEALKTNFRIRLLKEIGAIPIVCKTAIEIAKVLRILYKELGGVHEKKNRK